MKLRPFEDRVIIRQTEASKESEGVLLPEGAQKPPAEGVVVAVGPGLIRGDTLYLSAIYKLLRWAIMLWWSFWKDKGDYKESMIEDVSDYSPMQVKVGDYIMFGKYAGTEIKVDGELLIMVRQADCFMADDDKIA